MLATGYLALATLAGTRPTLFAGLVALWTLGAPAVAAGAVGARWAELRGLSRLPAAPGSFRALSFVGRAALLAGTGAVALPLLLLGVRVLWLLGNPL